jgi:hypothetical protein
MSGVAPHSVTVVVHRVRVPHAIEGMPHACACCCISGRKLIYLLQLGPSAVAVRAAFVSFPIVAQFGHYP